MKISAIKSQVKRAGRYSIFVDEKYSFSLSEQALLEARIVIGQELDTRRLEELKSLSHDDKIYNAVLNYLAIRPRSTWEIQTYLKRKEATEELVSDILSRLTAKRLLDDRDFAERWVASRTLLKPTSKRKLSLELKVKHVPNEIITEVLASDDVQDGAILLDIVARKRKQSKYQDDTKLMQYLARQGFNYEDIKDALKVDD